MVLLRRTEGIADLLRKLREQFDADEGGLIVKYEEGTFFSVWPCTHLCFRTFHMVCAVWLNVFLSSLQTGSSTASSRKTT